MSYRFATRLLHEAFEPDKATGATTSSICQTTAYAKETAEDMAAIFAGRKQGFIYTRVGNPTLGVFERRIAVRPLSVQRLSDGNRLGYSGAPYGMRLQERHGIGKLLSYVFERESKLSRPFGKSLA